MGWALQMIVRGRTRVVSICGVGRRPDGNRGTRRCVRMRVPPRGSVRARADGLCHDQVSAVVHSVCAVLAAGPAGADPLSAGVAGAAAVPCGGHRSGRRAGAGERDHLPAGADDPGDLKSRTEREIKWTEWVGRANPRSDFLLTTSQDERTMRRRGAVGASTLRTAIWHHAILRRTVTT